MYRFAVTPYANALPLTHFLPEVCPTVELVPLAPRATLAMLQCGDVDAAIIPVADLFGAPDVHVATPLGVASPGPVKSVLLQCRRPVEEVTSVAMDPESRTANALSRLLLREHFGLGDRVRFLPPGRSADAEVIIGDRAILSPPAPWSYDLASEWRTMTGLPFVFAVWACRRDCQDQPGLTRVLRAAWQRGAASIDLLAAMCAERLNLPSDTCRRYLRDNICYDLGPAELAGMNRFRELLAAYGGPGTEPISLTETVTK